MSFTVHRNKRRIRIRLRIGFACYWFLIYRRSKRPEEHCPAFSARVSSPRIEFQEVSCNLQSPENGYFDQIQ